MRSLLLLALPLLAACASSPEAIPNQHRRPIVEREGGTWLWAGEDDDWFEVSDSPVDPVRFQYGIGRDTIPSIDAPVHVAPGDPRLLEAGVDADTPVLGVVLEGRARAYPVHVLDRHEVVNDRFGGEAYAVLW